MTIDWEKPVGGDDSARIARIIERGRSAAGGLEAARIPDERIERLSAALRPLGMQGGDRVKRIIEGASSGLNKVKVDGQRAVLTVAEVAGLEAVIRTDGSRPVLSVRDGFVDTSLPDVGEEWQGRLQAHESGLRQVIAAVGGIRVSGQDPVGTAFVVRPALVVTARHVLEAIADQEGAEWTLKRPNETTIDFVGEDGATRKTTFQISRVEYAPPDPINRTINFANLDMAILRVDLDSDREFPPAVLFVTDQAAAQPHRRLCVIGFPARVEIFVGAGEPRPGEETAQVIHEIFEDKFGIKRLAPGEVVHGPGELDGDDEGWVFEHDASTVWGNSGSAVVDLASEQAQVIGLHFGGWSRRQNWAHILYVLQDLHRG